MNCIKRVWKPSDILHREAFLVFFPTIFILLLNLYEWMLLGFFHVKLWVPFSPVLSKDEFCITLKSSLESCQGEEKSLHNTRSYLEIQSQGL